MLLFAYAELPTTAYLQAFGGQRVDALLQLGVQRGGDRGIGAKLVRGQGDMGTDEG